MVFITGTLENKGRVASHPKKTSSPKPSKAKDKRQSAPTHVAAQPLRPAWDDYIALLSNGVEHRALLTTLQIPLRNIIKDISGREGGSGFTLSLSSYSGPGLGMSAYGQEIDTSAQCLVHLPEQDEGNNSNTAFCV